MMHGHLAERRLCPRRQGENYRLQERETERGLPTPSIGSWGGRDWSRGEEVSEWLAGVTGGFSDKERCRIWGDAGGPGWRLALEAGLIGWRRVKGWRCGVQGQVVWCCRGKTIILS